MKEIMVSYTNLAPLFLLDKTFEEKPDPFRLQGDRVMFIIPFNEYKLFIAKYLGTVDYLATPTKTLKAYLNTQNDIELYRAYMKDVAVAIGKELYYSETYGKSATHYKHLSDGNQTYTKEDLFSIYKMIGNQTAFRDYLSSHDFKLPNSFMDSNFDLWVYSNVLYFFSQSISIEWEVDANDG